MYITDDPVADFEKYDYERNKKLEELPLCSECGEHVQDEYYFEMNGEIICHECLIENHRKWVDDFIC